MKPTSTNSTPGLPSLKSELTAIAVDLQDVGQRVRQLAERIALVSDHVLSPDLVGRNNGVRPSLMSAAFQTLLGWSRLRGDAAVWRYREALEIVDRVAGLHEDAELLLMERPKDLARYLTARYGSLDQEIMGALYLDIRNRLIAGREVFRGTFVRAVVEPRQILRPALELGAAGFVVWHTHPSCETVPSDDDMAFTGRLEKAGEIVGVRLIDHLILGGRRWVSLTRLKSWRHDDESVDTATESGSPPA